MPEAPATAASTADDGANGDSLLATQCERHGHATHRERGTSQRRHRRKNAVREIADMQILSVHRRSGFAHLCVHDHAHSFGSVVHGEHGAQVADHRCDDVALFSAAKSYARGVDRFLT